MLEYSFPRYLAAKKPIDDRALNQHVWDTMARTAQPAIPGQPLRVLEVGCGIGTMLDRLVERGVADHYPIHYTGVDAEQENISQAQKQFLQSPIPNHQSSITFLHADLFSLPATLHQASFDLLIAHAVLDLLDIPRALPVLFSFLRPGGVFYFTINFDGETIFQPEHPLDSVILPLYHRTMDERMIDGRVSGDSRAGRHLFGHLKTAGAEILEVGSSDWVVFPHGGRYPGDEAYFLYHISHFFEQSLQNTGLDKADLNTWLELRRIQIERGELAYLAHQLDYVGRI